MFVLFVESRQSTFSLHQILVSNIIIITKIQIRIQDGLKQLIEVQRIDKIQLIIVRQRLLTINLVEDHHFNDHRDIYSIETKHKLFDIEIYIYIYKLNLCVCARVYNKSDENSFNVKYSRIIHILFQKGVCLQTHQRHKETGD